MTELQKMYLVARMKGNKHRQAVQVVAEETGIDEASVSRALARAKREDERDEKKGRAA